MPKIAPEHSGDRPGSGLHRGGSQWGPVERRDRDSCKRCRGPVTCPTCLLSRTSGRRAAGHSAEMGVDSKDLVREALDGLFRRRAEAERFYCAPCLVARFSRAFPPAAVQTGVADAFERPGSLRVKLGGPCAACRKRRRCIGVSRLGPSAPP